jgi:DNA-binding NarL/FixJ family response regulator
MIRILIVDDHAILRAGIRELLKLHPDFQVVGEASDGRGALDMIKSCTPDVVLMDLNMPGLDGLSATREITAFHPETKVLVLTQHENREYVLPALKVGAAGYVLKRAPDDTLVRAIECVHGGGTFLDPRISDLLANEMKRQGTGAPSDPYDSLSEREREIMVLLAKGASYKDIANTLFISVKTVEFHRTNLMSKMNFSNRSDITRFAMRRKLIS